MSTSESIIFIFQTRQPTYHEVLVLTEAVTFTRNVSIRPKESRRSLPVPGNETKFCES